MKSIVLLAFGLYESTDKLAREALEEALLLDSRQPYFTGFEPNGFELPAIQGVPRAQQIRLGRTILSDQRFWALSRLSFAANRETRQTIAFIGNSSVPTYSNSLLERSQGLDLPQDESLWTQIEMGARPTDWLFVRGSIHGGASLTHFRDQGSEGSPGWYHPENLYAEARWNSFVLSLGRKSLFWGQADSGALLVSDNATNFDRVEISSLAQRWPWIFSYLGDLKASLFLSRLNDNRVHPNDWFSGFRLGIKPTPIFELNLAFMYQFGGHGIAGHSAREVLVEVLGGRTETGAGVHDVTNATNRSAELDMRFSFSDWKIPTSIYWENYLEDCCGSIEDILTKSYGYSFGVLQRSSAAPDALKWRVEYVRLPNSTYWNGGRPSGWTNENALIGNPVGRDSQRVIATLGQYRNQIRSEISGSVFWQERLRTGMLVRESIKSAFTNFASEKSWGLNLGTKTQVLSKTFFDSVVQYQRVQERDNLKGHSTNEWGMLARFEFQF